MRKRAAPSIWHAHALHALLTCLVAAGSCAAAEGAAAYAVPAHEPCEVCHRIPADLITEETPFPPGVNPSSVCLDCHNYGENHHPVGFVPEVTDDGGESLNNFPLFEGEVRCLTCHDPHGGEGHTTAPKLLRGGPYRDRTGICFQCHDRDINTRTDPHVMFDRSGRIRTVDGQPVCLMCHRTVPDQSRGRSVVNFRADVAFLCWRCHPPMGGGFFSSHFLVKPSKKARRQMRKTERDNGIAFPLLNRNRITCSTCHNPHQDGVILYGPAQAGADTHDKLRLPPQRICEGCHGIK